MPGGPPARRSPPDGLEVDYPPSGPATCLYLSGKGAERVSALFAGTGLCVIAATFAGAGQPDGFHLGAAEITAGPLNPRPPR